MPRIIPRADWGAVSRSLPDHNMRLPATRVALHHTVTQVTSDPFADMRLVERVGLHRYGQFSYSYAIHPRDGEILEGCGLKRGAHTRGQNSTTFGIVWIGNYNERAPKIQQIESTRWLIGELTRQGHLRSGADIIGHRDAIDPDTDRPFATACPGGNLYKFLPAIRVPWSGPMAGDPNRADVNAPCVGGMPAYDANGNIKGYLLIGADYGVFAFGEGAAFLGNVEYNPPSGREWLPKA